ncbi:pyrroline-5-carboxylate reductase [Thermococcus sp.]|uniref:pyrroline-5-carboxylate reductase n=1 Tax=Thermococcus sp. TaxID=35749 RepID=UPI00261224FF|nr:pyrroline-5-carboxylate reductase [Thermococcus sp.]
MKVAVIGAGTIGSAVVRALSEAGHEVVATRRNLEKVGWLEEYGVKLTRNNREAVEWAEAVFLAVKPNKVGLVLGEVSDLLTGKFLISLAAGIGLNYLRRLAPKVKAVRAMPNIAILVKESFTAYATDLEGDDLETIKGFFSTFGRCIRVDEEHMDAITGLSGSGPAYVTVFLEAMVYGGLRVGLPRETARLAALQTLLGTAKLLMETDKHPAEVREWVITPGGTTIDGVFELEEGRVRTAVMKAVDAAAKKSRILSRKI